MQSTGAYRPVSLAEALECARCVLEQGEWETSFPIECEVHGWVGVAWE